MEVEQKYWFYLEPYTFIFQVEGNAVIYNTLNSVYLVVPNDTFTLEILNQLNDTSNGYCLILDEEQLSNTVFKQFVQKVQASFSGGFVVAESKTSKPFLFKPMLFLNTNIRKSQEEDLLFLGERVLEHLNEVTLYLPEIKEHSYKSKYADCYKQMLHPISWEGECLKVSDYLSFLLDLNASGVSKVNILGGDLIRNEYFSDLYPTVVGCKFKRSYYVLFEDLSEKCKDWLSEDNTEMTVLVHSGFDQKQIKEWVHFFLSSNVIWQFVISSEKDVQEVELLDFPVTVRIELKPYYTGNNMTFFERYIFSSLEDIIAEPLSKKTIFRRQVLNENFFGKLTMFPSGKVYANVNCNPIGYYPQKSLKELVFEELTHSSAWFRLRDQQPCVKCVNKYLCPSISNYELVMGRDNLCTVKRK